MTQTVDGPLLSSLLGDFPPPCVSIYQPTHRHFPDNAQDPIRFKNLLKRVEASLEVAFPETPARSFLEPFRDLAADGNFWNHTADGLGIFAAQDFFRVLQFQRTVPEIAIVAETFHIKPMLRILQSADRYQILSLSRQRIRLFQGDRDTLDEVELADAVPQTIAEALGEETTEPHLTVASYGGASAPPMHHAHGSRKDEVQVDEDRFFRIVDSAIRHHHSQPAGLPLILAAPREHQGHFRAISQNPFLMARGIESDVSQCESAQLLEAAWTVMEPAYRARLEQLTGAFRKSRMKRLGSEHLSEAAEAAAQSRVETLLVDADRQIPGSLNRETGEIAHTEGKKPGVDDLLDDLAEMVIHRGGKVLVLPREDMPTTTGLAAIYRY